MKRIRLLLTISSPLVSIFVARETEIIQGEVLNLQTYVSLETVGKNSAVIAHLYKVLYNFSSHVHLKMTSW